MLECFGGVKVCLIEVDKKWVEYVVEVFKKIVVLYGDGFSLVMFVEVGVVCFELVVCVINDDKVNMLVVVMFKGEGVKWVISLINECLFESMCKFLGIDVFIDLCVMIVLIIF